MSVLRVLAALALVLGAVHAVPLRGVKQIRRPPMTAAGALNFTVIGDWGGQPTYPFYTTRESNTARAMGNIAATYGSQFTLALGDNFYTGGVFNAEDTRFNDTFESVFINPSLQNTWYVLAGNHDHYGNVSGEIAYSQYSKRWHFPSLWYDFTHTIPGTSSTVQFVYIDTVTMSGNSMDTDHGPLPGPASRALAEEQLQWLQQTLSTSNATWIIVCGHYPVWSAAEHGPTQELLTDVKPLLEKYGVAAYMNGHDHSLQHINTGSTVDYWVIGAGNYAEYNMTHQNDIPAGSLKYFWPDYYPQNNMGGFASVTVTESEMTVYLVGDDESVRYSSSKKNPRASMGLGQH